MGISRQEIKKHKKKITPDDEVEFIANFIKKNVREIKRGEKIITYRVLRKILNKFDIFLEDPKRNQISVVRHTKERKGFFRKKEIFKKN